MKTFLHLTKHRSMLLGGLWLCLSLGASALTLGPNTRSAVLGGPLDLAMQLMLDTVEDPQELCLDAEVFYADRLLDSASVRITSEKGGTDQDWLIHVRSAIPVEGPVVTVHLRAGCVQKTMRRYVVLAATKPRGLTAGTAAAAISAGKSASPTDGTTDASKVQALEAELRQLRAEMMRDQATLAETRLHLEQAENSRFSKVLVYALAALCSMAFLGLLFLWYLLPKSRPASPGPATDYSGFGRETEVSTGLASFAPSRTADLDVNESLFDGLRRASRYPAAEPVPPLSPQDRPRFSVSVPFVPRTVKAPELLELQQQVEAFSVQGHQAKAIAILRKHLVDNVKTSALVYLDLLDLYHQEGDMQAYENLREDFNKVFNTRIAPFDQYVSTPAGASLQADILLRIQGAWPTRDVLRIIEEVLFREPGKGTEVLVLEAYRELLMLYAVAREIIDLESSASGSACDVHWPDLSMQPRASPRLGLDIDLAQLSGGGNSKPADSLTAGAPSLQKVTRAGTLSGLAKAPHTSEFRDSRRAGLPSLAEPMINEPDSANPTGLNSLVDFDDYDTGYRPDDFTKSKP